MIDEPSRVSPLGVLALVAVILGVGGLAWLRASAGGPEGGTLAHIRLTGVVRIGIANEAPYGYLDTDTGRVTGEAPEVARAIFRRLGARDVQVVNTEFGALIPGLKASRFDVVAAGMYITPERCREIDFSNPTYRIGESFIVRSGNPRGLRSYAHVVADGGARLGVVAGTVEQGYARSLGVPRDRVVIYNDNVSALEGLRAGQIDAYACTVLTAQTLLAKAAGTGVAIAEDFVQPVIGGEEVWGYGAFGFRPHDDLLRAAVDRELEAFLGTPEHLDLVRPFGFGEATLPGDATAAELCDAGEG